MAAARKTPAKKPVPAASKAASIKKPGASVSKSKSSAKRTASSRRRGARTTARRSAPRQTAPTPERYKEIQQALSEKGYYNGPVDGKWTPECVAALKRFQADQSLQPDGKLGALSLIALGLGPKRDPLPQQLISKPAAEGVQSPN